MAEVFTDGAKKKRNEAGSGLIVVLWVTGLLALLVGSFVFDAHIEARIISYYRKRSKAEYLAKSGIELATLLITKSHQVKGSAEPDDEDVWREDALKLSQGGAISGLENEVGDGRIILSIEPETGLRNINNLGGNDAEREQNLERILEVGGITEDTGLWPVLIESFLDWTDADNLPRAAGAETEDYYATLDPPYRAKNGPVDTVEELLLIKGYTPAILFGGPLDPESQSEDAVVLQGIHNLLTIYGDGTVNINAAGTNVLMTLPGIDEVAAGAIIEERQGFGRAGDVTAEEDYSYKDVNDLFTRVPGLNSEIRQYVSTVSTIYRITSVGEVGGVSKKVWCVANYNGKELVVLRWLEEDMADRN